MHKILAPAFLVAFATIHGVATVAMWFIPWSSAVFHPMGREPLVA